VSGILSSDARLSSGGPAKSVLLPAVHRRVCVDDLVDDPERSGAAKSLLDDIFAGQLRARLQLAVVQGAQRLHRLRCRWFRVRLGIGHRCSNGSQFLQSPHRGGALIGIEGAKSLEPCVMCGRQFTPNAGRPLWKHRALVEDVRLILERPLAGEHLIENQSGAEQV